MEEKQISVSMGHEWLKVVFALVVDGMRNLDNAAKHDMAAFLRGDGQ